MEQDITSSSQKDIALFKRRQWGNMTCSGTFNDVIRNKKTLNSNRKWAIHKIDPVYVVEGTVSYKWHSIRAPTGEEERNSLWPATAPSSLCVTNDLEIFKWGERRRRKNQVFFPYQQRTVFDFYDSWRSPILHEDYRPLWIIHIVIVNEKNYIIATFHVHEKAKRSFNQLPAFPVRRQSDTGESLYLVFSFLFFNIPVLI